MAPTYAPTAPLPRDDSSFPIAAIVVLAIGGYMIIFVIILIIRKCILNKGESFCPVWCSESCRCESCCAPSNEGNCMLKFAQACNCNVPNKRKCVDTVCPTKQWCDDTFCCCFSQQPQGECCKCDSCTCGECADCCDCKECCPDCKDVCDDCKCQCCAQPETIDCCCIEVKLAGSGPAQSGGPMNQSTYHNQGGSYNQSGYPGGPIQQQPGNMPQMSMQSHAGGSFQAGSSFHPGYSQSFHPGQFQQGGQMGQPQVGYSRQSSRLDSGRFGASQNFSAQQFPPATVAHRPAGMFQARSPNQL